MISHPLTESRPGLEAARSLAAGPSKVYGLETKFSAHQQPCYCTSLKLRPSAHRPVRVTKDLIIFRLIKSQSGSVRSLICYGTDSFVVCHSSSVPRVVDRAALEPRVLSCMQPSCSAKFPTTLPLFFFVKLGRHLLPGGPGSLS